MSQALLDAGIAIKEERGMLSIGDLKHPGKAIYKQSVNVFLYYTILEVDKQVVTLLSLFINWDTYASHTKPMNGTIFRILLR
jgi:hypothetical protein